MNSTNRTKRKIFGIMMFTTFLLAIIMGPLGLLLFEYTIQVSCFWEVLNIGCNHNKIPESFKWLSWYFWVVANYFFVIEIIVTPHFKDYYKNDYILQMVKYNRFISFCLYFAGIILFVFNLRRKYCSKPYKILAYTHILLIFIVIQSYLKIDNLFNGMIWIIVPVCLVIVNDTLAYKCGRIWGKTPLISLSPKKTWEGFVGAALGTFVSGFILSNILCRFKYFVCPLVYKNDNITDCEVAYIFQPMSGFTYINLYPFSWHFFAMAFFASVVAPFGGFCASGLKRAFKIKDFGNTIPGHGGMMDRFDCHFLMATFVNVYIYTFVKTPSVETLYAKILDLSEEGQVQFYYMLKESLESNLKLL